MEHRELELGKHQESKAVRKGAILTLVCLSHVTNHIQTGVFNVMYPLLRQEFGFGYLGIGLLETVYQSVGSLLQITYGFLTRFVGRGILLGVGNIVAALGLLGLGFSKGYPHLMVSAGIRAIGSSAQHPVGAATLASQFENKRAQVLGLHQSTGNIGSWIAPILTSSLLLFLRWRQILWIVAVVCILMGIAYFAFRELMVPAISQGSGGQQRSRARAGLTDYRAVLKDRNMIFLILAILAGAAGRGTNVLSTYLTTYLVDRYQIEVPQAGIFFAAMMSGAIVGPVAMGWLADKFSHKLIAQFSLVAAAIFTFTIIFHSSANWILAAHLMLAGVFMYARGSLLETLFTRAIDKVDLDTLLSIYYGVAFVSGPMWTMVAGVTIDRFGFTPAFAIMAASYLIGTLFLAFVRFMPHKKGLGSQV